MSTKARKREIRKLKRDGLPVTPKVQRRRRIRSTSDRSLCGLLLFGGLYE